MIDVKSKEVLVVKEGNEYVLVKKADIQELIEEINSQPEWSSGLDWLAEQTGISSHDRLKEKILYPFKDELADFVDYPNGSGGRWRFNIKPMKYWLRLNFTKVAK